MFIKEIFYIFFFNWTKILPEQLKTGEMLEDSTTFFSFSWLQVDLTVCLLLEMLLSKSLNCFFFKQLYIAFFKHYHFEVMMDYFAIHWYYTFMVLCSFFQPLKYPFWNTEILLKSFPLDANHFTTVIREVREINIQKSKKWKIWILLGSTAPYIFLPWIFRQLIRHFYPSCLSYIPQRKEEVK